MNLNIAIGLATGTIAATSGNFALGGVISGTNVTFTGPNQTTLSGANTYTGATTISGGTLALGATGVLSNSTVVSISGGAVLNLSTFNDTVGGLTLTNGTVAGSGTLTTGSYALNGGSVAANLGAGAIGVTASGTQTSLSGTAAATSVDLVSGTFSTASANRFSATPTVSASSGAVLALGGNETLGLLTGSGTVTIGSGNTATVNTTATGTFAGVVSGQGGLTKSGTGVWTLSGANTFTGATTLTAGGLSVVGTMAATSMNITSGTLSTASANRFSATPAAAISSGAVLALGGSETLGLLTGSGTVTIGNGNTATVNTSANGTFAGVVSGQGGLTKSGAGGWILSGANTYTGATTVSSGTLAYGAANALSDSTAVTVSGGVLDLATFADTVGGLTISSGTVAGVSGTLTTGSYALNGGSVAANLGAGAIGVTASGTQASLSGTAAATSVNVVSGTLSTASANRFSATPAAAISSGAVLALGGSETLGLLTGSGTVTIGNGNTATVNTAANGTFAGVVSGAGGLTKSGAGVWTLSGANTYTGATTVSGGTLAYGAANALSNSTAVTVSNATVTLGSFTDTIASLTTGNTGTATLTFTVSSSTIGALTTTGGVTLGSGSTVFAFSGAASGTAGRYDFLSYAGSLSGNYGSSGLGSTNYTLQSGGASNATLFLQRKAEFGTITPSYTSGTNAIIKGGTAAFGFTVANVTPTGGANLTVASAAGASNVVGTATTGSVNVAPQATSGTVTGFSFSATGTGSQNGTFTLNNANAVSTSATGTVTYSVYDNASPTLGGGTTIALGNIHAGYATAITGTLTGVTNAAGFRVAMSGSAPTVGNLSLSSLASLAAGSSGSIVATLAPGQATGAISQAITYTFGDASSLPGANPSVLQQSILTTGQVYSGAGTWNQLQTGTFSWGTLTGTGVNTFSQNWTTAGGSPGLDSAFTTTDTATFGTFASSGTTVVLLNGASPSLNTIAFNNASTVYDLDVGTGGTGRITLAAGGTNAGTINVQAGSHQIHTELTLASNLAVAVAANSSLTLHAAITGSTRSLSKSGAGLLVVNGINSFSGGTTISGGTLAIGNATSPLGSGAVVLSNGATLNLQGFTISNTIDANNGYLINPGAVNADITGTTTLSGSAVLGTYSVKGNGRANLDGPLGNPATTAGGQITVASAGVLAATGTVTQYGSVTILAGGIGTLAAVNGSVITSGSTVFGGDVLALADIKVNGGSATFNGPTYGDVNVDVSGTDTGSASATFNGTIYKTAHAYASGTVNVYGSVAAGADVKAEAGGTVRMYGSGTFGQASMVNNGSFVIDRTTDLVLATIISGSGSVRKAGSSILTIAGNNTYTGPTLIDSGTLRVNGSLASGTLSLAAASWLAGTGTVAGVLTGAGSIGPGNSPGVLTASRISSSAMDFAFEFTASGSSVWGSPGTSNDVLRLTGTSPFDVALGSGNVVDVYFNVDSIAPNTAFQGGFFTDSQTDFLASVQNATYNYYVKSAGGSVSYNGQTYTDIATWASTNMPMYTGVSLLTKQATTNFGTGSITGYTTEFVVVPEPGSLACGSIGLVLMAWVLRSRNQRG